MPQVDIVTFYPILFWTTIVYLTGLLALSLGPLFFFVGSLKLSLKRATGSAAVTSRCRKVISTLTTFPLIAL